MDSKNSIGYYLRPNPTDTAAEAPYLPKLVPNGVANLNDIAERISASLPVSAERAKLLIREAFTEAIGMALQAYTVDMGALRMKARIPGSMPCEDTPFDPEANACVIELYADTELSGAFEALKLVRLSAAELATAIKVSNVTDVATMSIGEIHGTDEFIITGNGVTLDAAGESAKLVDRKTGAELATAEVVTVSKGQRATCKFNPVAGGIAKGSYWLVVTTFGLIGETSPRVFRKPVTLTEAIPAPAPTVERIVSEGKDGIVKGEAFAAHGANLSFHRAAGDSVTVKWTQDGEEKSLALEPSATDPTKISFDAVEAFDDIPDETELTFVFELSGENVTATTGFVEG